ncbi:MAG: type II secretion system major pseudopilin GspG [Phycisphaerales bacterium]|nr:type II secretion system major pseudopilin GspG [Phycisphaerales bacterium]
MNRMNRWNRMGRRTSARGFTLIEVMIVIAIVLALSAIVALRLFGRKEQADVSLTQTDVNNIKRAFSLFRLDFNRWPTEEEGVAVLWDKEKLDPEADQSKWQKYLEEPMEKDRWGNPWGYHQQSERGDESEYDLWSYGPNGEDENGEGDDVTSWRKTSEDDGGDSRLMAPPSSSSSGSGG